MSNPSRLLDLVVEWEQRCASGENPTAEDICRDYPELLDAFRQQVQALEAREPLVDGASRDTVELHRDNAQSVGAGLPGDARPPQIPGYEILSELGHGGMGVVYKARQTDLQRIVALKIINEGRYSPEDLLRFRREAEALAQLRHPNLVAVYAVGAQAGRPFFAMEYVDGSSLDARIRAQRQPPEATAALVATLARALDAVHRQGIIHRDLKPANILLSADGSPRVTDFGLAKRMGATNGATMVGQVLGTPSYMSPEQAEGRVWAVGPATDVYGLGTILYEMLTGRPPFCASTPWETVRLVSTAEPRPLRRLAPETPRDLESICLKCLQKNPSRRYASAGALADDLQRFLDREPVQARRISIWERGVKWARRRPALAGLLAVSVLAFAALTIGYVTYSVRMAQAYHREHALADENRSRLIRMDVTQGVHALDESDWCNALPWFVEALRLDQDPPERQTNHRIRLAGVLRETPALCQVWFHDGPVRHADFSRDGMQALIACDAGSVRVWNVETGQPAFAALPHPAAVTCAAFDCSGQTIASACADGNARLWRGRESSAPLHVLKHASPVQWIGFDEPGQRVATASADGSARVWDAHSGTPLTRPLLHGGAVRMVAFSPDGGRLVTASDDHTARLWDSRSGEAVGLRLEHEQAVTCVAFDFSGLRLATGCDDGLARLWDATTGRALGKPLRHRASITDVAFTPDGQRVLTASDDHAVCIWDAKTGDLTLSLLGHSSGINAVACSADGRRVASCSDDNSACVWDARSGESLTPYLRHGGTVHQALFSPDGRRLLTIGNDRTARLWDLGGLDSLYTRRAAPPAQRLAESRRWWSSDRRWMVTAEGGITAQVRRADSGVGVGPPLVHGSEVTLAVFSPLADWLLTVSDDNAARIWNLKHGASGTPPLRHKGSIRCAAFSPDATRVMTASYDRTARVWDTRTGEALSPPIELAGQAERVWFDDQGQTACVAIADGLVRAWSLRPDVRSLEELSAWAEILSGSRIDPICGLLPLESSRLQEAWEKSKTSE